MQWPSDAASPAAGVSHLCEILLRPLDHNRSSNRGEFQQIRGRRFRERGRSLVPMSSSVMPPKMLVSRRSLLRAAAVVPALSLPGVLRAESQTTLRFIPVIDLSFIDPIYSTAQVSRNHGFMVYDTLYGMNSALEISPQMVSGHVVSNDDRQWDLILRDGLLWHDGERVLARDCVASIRRWAARDGFGAELMAATDELSAPDDRTIRFRLKRPFPLLPAALGKSAIQAPFMMPERLANQDAFKPLTEVVGSGPFRRRRARAGRPQRLCPLRSLSAARVRHGGLDGRAEDRALRSRGLDHDAGCSDRSCGAADRRAGLAGNHAA